MVKTLQGYFQSGRFIPTENTTIPECVEVYVIITDKMVDLAKTKAQKQLDALEMLMTANEAIDDEHFDEEFDAILSRRTSITRELEL